MCYGSFCFTLDLTSCSGVGASAGQVLTDLFSAVPPTMSQVGDTTKKWPMFGVSSVIDSVNKRIKKFLRKYGQPLP